MNTDNDIATKLSAIRQQARSQERAKKEQSLKDDLAKNLGLGGGIGVEAWSSKIVRSLWMSAPETFGLTLVPLTFYGLFVDLIQSPNLTHPDEPIRLLLRDANISKILFYTLGMLATLIFIILVVMIIVAVYYALNPTEGIMAFVKGIISYITD